MGDVKDHHLLYQKCGDLYKEIERVKKEIIQRVENSELKKIEGIEEYLENLKTPIFECEVAKRYNEIEEKWISDEIKYWAKIINEKGEEEALKEFFLNMKN